MQRREHVNYTMAVIALHNECTERKPAKAGLFYCLFTHS